MVRRYQQVNASLAKQMWVEAHASSNRQHGTGNRLRELHLLTGLVLPIWPQIESCLSQQLKPSQRRLNVMRLETTGWQNSFNFFPYTSRMQNFTRKVLAAAAPWQVSSRSALEQPDLAK